jgi:hypothetical protein
MLANAMMIPAKIADAEGDLYDFCMENYTVIRKLQGVDWLGNSRFTNR